MEASHQFISVSWEETTFDVLRLEARRSSCRVRLKGQQGVLNQGERGVVVQGDRSNGEERPSGKVLCSRCRVTASHLRDDCLGVGSRWIIQQGGAGLGKLAFCHQGRGPVISSLKVTRIVMVAGFRFPFPLLRSSWFVPERAPGTFKPLFAHSSHVTGGSFAVLLATSLPSKTNVGRHRRSVQAQVSLREVTPDRAARRQRVRLFWWPQGCAFGVWPRRKDFVQVWWVGV